MKTFDELMFEGEPLPRHGEPKHAERKKTVCHTDGKWLIAEVGLVVVGYVILAIVVLVSFNLE